MPDWQHAGRTQAQETVMHYRIETFRIKRIAALALASASTLIAALAAIIR